jgi:hypothetical protein
MHLSAVLMLIQVPGIMLWLCPWLFFLLYVLLYR